MHTPRIVLASGILVLGTLALLPTPAAAQSGSTVVEDFESYDAATLPCEPTPAFSQPCTSANGFTYTNGGGTQHVTSAVNDGGGAGNSYQITGTNTATFTGPTGYDVCAESITFGIRNLSTQTIFVAPNAGNSYDYYIITPVSLVGGGTGSARLDVTRNVNGVGSITGSTATLVFATAYSTSTFYHFTVVCLPSAAAGSATLYSTEALALGNGPVSTAVLAANTGTGYVRPNTFRLLGAAAGNTYYDNLETAVGYSAGSRFCANPAAPPNYEYEYVSDWTFDGDLESTGDSLDSGFRADTTTTETAYMGKGFTTGSRAFETVFTIEAGVEGAESLFGVAYTLGAGGLPSASTDGTGLENNGLDGGNFDDSIQVVFLEDGGDWNIGIHQNTGGTVARLGGAVAHGNPNTPTTYRFRVDTRDQIANLYDGDGALIFGRGLTPGFEDDALKDQWFAASANLVLFQQAITVLDDPDQTDEDAQDSTCIFDLEGTSIVNGGSGLQPPSEIFDDTPDESDTDVNTAGGVLAPGTTVPEGWTAAAMNGFLGVVLMGSIGGGAWAIFNKHWVAFLIGSVMGFILALLFQLFSLWILIAVVLISTAIIFLQVKRSAGASG